MENQAWELKFATLSPINLPFFLPFRNYAISRLAGGKMERSDLRAYGTKLALLNPIIEKPAKEGKIRCIHSFIYLNTPPVLLRG